MLFAFQIIATFMNLAKKVFTNLTGYWVHKKSTLPVGADLHVDIHNRLKYGPLKLVFDVGANIGQTREWFRRMEPTATIYSFEPVLETFEKLKLNAALDEKCIVEHLALGDVAENKTITLFEDNSCLNTLKDEVMHSTGNSKREIIKVDTLDCYCEKRGIQRIDFLKIDTEGYELNVLKGAENMLNTSAISFIYCEVGFLRSNIRNTYFADLTEWLAAKDYNYFGMYGLVSNGYAMSFGNALFVAKHVFS
jgi:FkbM family methyltransferase